MGIVRVVTLFNKPDYVQDAIECVRQQTRPAEHYVVSDNAIDWGDTFPPAAWFNIQWSRAGQDDYLCWLSDDDYWYPHFVELLAGYLDDNPEAMACYGPSRHILYERGRGEVSQIRVLGGDGHTFDLDRAPQGKLDAGQVMIRRSALNDIPYPWQPVGKAHGRICDAVFFSKFCARYAIEPATDQIVMENRTTPISAHTYMTPDGGYEARQWNEA